MVPSDGSTNGWFGDLRQGDGAAFEQIFQRFFHRLVAFARRRLAGARARRIADEEDVAVSALQSFWQGMKRGKFAHLEDQDKLWPLLAFITNRKAIDAVHKEQRRRPRGGTVRGHSLFGRLETDQQPRGFDQFPRQGPTEQSSAEHDEECRRLLDLLGDERLRRVAMLKLAGFTRDEIALRIGYSVSTVSRMLKVIRRIWKSELSR